MRGRELGSSGKPRRDPTGILRSQRNRYRVRRRERSRMSEEGDTAGKSRGTVTVNRHQEGKKVTE